MNFKINILFGIILLLCTVTLSGCWDYKEYENLYQVIAMGVDYDKNSKQTTVTLQVLETKQSGGGSKENTQGVSKSKNPVYSSTDKTFFGALSKFSQVLPKKLFFGYLRVIVIGEEAAKYNMPDLIELLDRAPVIRNTFLIVSSNKAEETLATSDPSIEISSGQEIHDLLKVSENAGTFFPVTINEFAQMFVISGWEATLPKVTTITGKKNNTENPVGVSGGIRLDEQRKGDQRMMGMAVFKENKLVGSLDDKESRGFGWIIGKKINIYQASLPSDKSDSSSILYYYIVKSGSKIDAELSNDSPNIHINVRIEAQLSKYYTNAQSDTSEILTPYIIEHAQKALSESITSEINAVLNKCQKLLKSDIFGFGFAFFREYPSIWHSEYEKKWNSDFPDVPVSVNVESKILNTNTNVRKLNKSED